MHSGPVIGGGLRGDKARFQLFGDTVNTASRMERTGMARRIQMSQETADLLVTVGIGGWITAREDIVEVKGKGSMRTFWMERGTQPLSQPEPQPIGEIKASSCQTEISTLPSEIENIL